MNDTHEAPAVQRGAAAPSPNGQQPTLSDRVRALRLKGTSATTAAPRSAWLPWGIAAIAVLASIAFGVRAYLITPTDAPTAAADGTPANSTGSAPSANAGSTSSTGDVALDSKGNVIAAHQIKLSPQVGGEIIWLDPNFKEGAVYKKGDRLAEIDPVIYEAQVKNAKAALRVAEVNLQQAERGSTLNDILAAKAMQRSLAARTELSRVDERNKRRGGTSTTSDDLEKAVVQLLVDQSAHDNQKEIVAKLETSLEEQRSVCRAQLEAAQATLDQAEKNLKNCTMLAPTTGIILTKKAELGGFIDPHAFGVDGYLCEMADLRDLEIELDVQERDIGAVRPGQRCRIVPDAGQRDEAFKKSHPDGYSGVVSRRMPVANRSKGAITVRVKVDFPKDEVSGSFLVPDMGVLVSFMK